MNEAFIDQLISIWECEYIDFKREFHNDNASLVHDILCLVNSYCPQNRYLVFGVDDSKVKIGIGGDPKRKRNSDIQDLLRSSGINRVPDVRMHTVNCGTLEIDVLEILNRPDKPFYLTKDKIGGSERVRGGVIYTRLGDTNTPKLESAPEERIELMWRERFGIGIPPIERVAKLLRNFDDWEFPGDEREMHHRIFPEFVIRNGSIINDPFYEEWVENFPDKYAYSYILEIRYFGTLIKSMGFVMCDGGRYKIPIPRIEQSTKKLYVMKDSIEFETAYVQNRIFRTTGESLSDLFTFVGVEVR